MGSKKFSGVIFDLDGTLLDSIRDIAESMNASLAALGFPGHDISAYRLMVGTGVIDLARMALPERERSDALLKKCLHLMEIEYSLRWDRTSSLYPGISAMLNDLTRLGIRMAVLSNKPDEFTQMAAFRYLAAWSFRRISGAVEGKKRKPDPCGALNIARDFSLDPSQIVFIGDSGTDMSTASAAGMFPVGVLWGFRGAEELLECGAEMLISDPSQVIRLFSL